MQHETNILFLHFLNINISHISQKEIKTQYKQLTK